MLSPLPPLHLLRLNSRLFFLNSLLIADLGGERCKMDQPSENRAEHSSDFNPSKRFADEILPHILNLYASRATPRDFEIYAPDATFEDPLMCAHGVKQIKSSFYSLSKVFSESRIVEYSIKENVLSPGKHEILMDNKQYYKFMGRGIDMISLIKLDIEGGKVVRHEDRWDKKPLRNRETVGVPLVGRAIEMARRGSMFATHLLMGFGKDPTASKKLHLRSNCPSKGHYLAQLRYTVSGNPIQNTNKFALKNACTEGGKGSSCFLYFNASLQGICRINSAEHNPHISNS